MKKSVFYYKKYFIFYISQLLITDPTEDEEKLALSALTIVFNEKSMCMVHKSGGIPMSQKLLIKCVSKAKSRGEQLRKLILTAASTVKCS